MPRAGHDHAAESVSYRMRIGFPVLALLAFALFGCTNEDPASVADTAPAKTVAGSIAASSVPTGVVGKYKAQIDIPADAKKDPMADMAQSLAESMTLELKADKTFTIQYEEFVKRPRLVVSSLQAWLGTILTIPEEIFDGNAKNNTALSESVDEQG